jgi:hypothetical protein
MTTSISLFYTLVVVHILGGTVMGGQPVYRTITTGKRAGPKLERKIDLEVTPLIWRPNIKNKLILKFLLIIWSPNKLKRKN